MKKFVISLEKSKDRRRAFEQRNKEIIGEFEYFDAIVGEKLKIEELSSKIFTKNSKNYSLGAIGCAMSHLKLWEKCIELNETIMILEDDVIVNKDFNRHLTGVMDQLPKDFDIVLLSYNFDSVLSYQVTCYETCNAIFGRKMMNEDDIKKFIKSDIYPGLAKLNHCFGTSAYIVSPKGAKRLQERCFPLNNTPVSIPFLNTIPCYTIDCMMNTVYKNISAYVCLSPFVMTPHLSENYKSTIG